MQHAAQIVGLAEEACKNDVASALFPYPQLQSARNGLMLAFIDEPSSMSQIVGKRLTWDALIS